MAGKNGGKRANAGRPKGVPNLLKLELRNIILSKLGPEKLLILIDKMYDLSMKGDSTLMMYILNQIYGKPRERLTLDGEMTINHKRIQAKQSLKEKLQKINKSNAVITKT